MRTRGDPSTTHGTYLHVIGRMDGPLGRGEPQGAALLSGLADLPVEQPTKFELVVNLKAAKTLGPAIAQSILDEVVQ
jgi:hypothetical protein